MNTFTQITDTFGNPCPRGDMIISSDGMFVFDSSLQYVCSFLIVLMVFSNFKGDDACSVDWGSGYW